MFENLIYENSQDPNSAMQPMVVFGMQIGAAALAYKSLPIVGRMGASAYYKIKNEIFEASDYDASVDPSLPKPKANSWQAFKAGALNFSLSIAQKVAIKTAYVGGVLIAIVNTPRILNSDAMKMLRNHGSKITLEHYFPSAAVIVNHVVGLDAAGLKQDWDAFNQAGADYTSAGVDVVNGVCSSLYHEPGSWVTWGVRGALNMVSSGLQATWHVIEPQIDEAATWLHGHTRQAVSTLSRGFISAEGGELYFELAGLVAATGLYWRYGPSVTVNNSNHNQNIVTINALPSNQLNQSDKQRI